MSRRLTCIAVALALVVPATVILGSPPVSAVGTTFSNAASITLNNPSSALANATPYPSTIAVSALSGTINHLAVTLSGVSYSHSQDIDALLVGPSGQTLILVANLGPNSGATAAANNSTLTLDDAGTLPTQLTPWASSSTFKPVNFGGFNEVWGPPAPTPPYGDPGTTGAGATLGSVFNGTSPNGTWSLFVITTAVGDGTGAIAGGWSLNLTTANAATTTTTAVSSNNPSFTAAPGNSVTFTATVHKASDNSNVNEGTVTFKDGASTLCNAVAVSAGQATCTTTFSAEGPHTILAQFNGTANFGQSSATLTQQVDNHTTVTGSSNCNTGSIALNNPISTTANANPYPSHVFVSGVAGTVSHLTVTLKGATYSHSQDIDALLVGPTGQAFILVAAAGPNSGGAISNVTLTLDDASATTLPQNSAWGAANATVTSKPVNYGGLNEVWGPPAPPPPYGNPGPDGGGSATLGSVFNGTNPNGTWSLFVITTAAGDGTGAIAGGWCADITTANASATTTTAVSSNNPSFTTAPGNSVTFTATVHKASDNSNVNEGTVTFKDGSTTIAGCGAVAVSAGQAACTTSFATEDSHPISVFYNGTVNFGPSSANLVQTVNNHTTVTGTSFCNTGSIALNNPASTTANATPYPSNVFVTGLSTNLLHLTVTLKGATYGHSQDIDALLVGPTGQAFILVAAAGPNSNGAINNVTLTLDDASATTLAATAPWGAPNATVTSKPVNFGGLNEVWGPPAPPGPYGNPGPAGGGSAALGSVFNGTNPNGTWSLYVITTAAGDGAGAIAGGWCVGLTVPQPPTISKSFGAASIPLGQSTPVTFAIANPASNTFPLTGVGFTDTLPAGLVVTTPNGLSNSCGGTATAVAGTNTISLTGGTLAIAGTCSFSVNVTGVAAGSQVNTTSVVSSVEGGSGGVATASVVVVAPPSIAKAFGSGQVALNGTTSLGFTIANPVSNSVALTGVGFADSFPAGLVVASPSGLAGSCGGGTVTAVAGSGSVSLSGATLAVGASCSFAVNVTASAAGSATNSVTVTSANGGTGNTATASLSSAAPPQIAKSFGAALLPLGQSVALGFTVVNPAANVGPLNGVAFTDTLPAGLVVASPNALSGSCGGGTVTAAAGSGSVSLAGATLSANGSCTLSVAVTGVSAGQKDNSVTVTSANGGAGNTSSASVTVVAPPSIAKSFGAASVPLGATTALAFSLANPNAAMSLSGVGFADVLPAGLAVASPNGLSGSCGGGTITAAAGSGTVSLSGATLAAGATCTFSVNVTAIGTGLQVNTTSAITSVEGGSGGTASSSLSVVKAPTTTTVTATPSSAPFGAPITFTAVVVPSQPNNSGVNPTGTVSFFLDGQAAPVANVALVGGQASFATSALGAGSHTVVATYSGDSKFAPSSSVTAATVTLTCTNNVTGNLTGSLNVGPGVTCVSGAHISGSIIVAHGAALDVENSTINGSFVASGAAAIRLCGNTFKGSVTVNGSNGFVLIGDPGDDGCAPNKILGALVVQNNHHGLDVIDNTVKGGITITDNSGTGPFPEDTGPEVSGNGP